MVAIIAAREVRYAGKTYRPGETFEATEKDAKLLVAIKKATTGAPGSAVDLPPAALEGDARHLRETYQTVVGKPPFSGWAPEELRGRIEAHQQGRTYNRRDMRAR